MSNTVKSTPLRLWEHAISPVGRPPKYKTPADLWAKALEYFKWCDDHPWLKVEPVKAGDHFGEHVHAPCARPYTLKGLTIFMGVSERYLYDLKPEFSQVISRVKDIIFTQKYEGAVVGAFNANIISRDLGYMDNNNKKLPEAQVFTLNIDPPKDK